MTFIGNFIKPFDYNTFGISTLAGSVLSLSVGLLVLSGNPRSKSHQSFFLITLTGGLWMLHYAFMNLVTSEVSAHLWLRLGYLFAVPYISPSVYLFTLQWTGYRRKKFLVGGGFLVAFLFGLIMFIWGRDFYDIRTHETWRLNFFRDTAAGTAYFYSLLAFFYFYALLAFKNIFKAWKEAPSRKDRSHYRNFIIGFLIGYTGSVDFMVARGIVEVFPFGFISFSIFILIIAYTIVRHQFLEINVVLKKISLIFLIYSVLFALLLPIVFPILNHALKQSASEAAFVLLLSLGIGLVLSMGPLIYAYLVRRNFWLRGNISTGLTHELKSPLSSIQGALDIALAQLKSPNTDKEKALFYLRMIEQNANRLDHFVKNLLHIAKSEEGAVSLNKSTTDLSELIRKTVQDVKPQLDLKQLTLAVDIPEKLDVLVDEQKIDQVFSNLISNAIKFSDRGTISIAMKASNSVCEFSIRDEGRGIATKDLDKVFDRFYQVKESGKGSGIGLTIAKAWVEAHGGKIWAESEGEGKGTTVRFTLPL